MSLSRFFALNRTFCYDTLLFNVFCFELIQNSGREFIFRAVGHSVFAHAVHSDVAIELLVLLWQLIIEYERSAFAGIKREFIAARLREKVVFAVELGVADAELRMNK